MIDRRSVLTMAAIGGAALYGLDSSAQSRLVMAGRQVSDETWRALLADYQFGIALAGLQFGPDVFPGRLNAEVQAPPPSRYESYADLGLRSVRLPFLWERLQPELFGPLDGTLDLLHADRGLGQVFYRDLLRRQLDLAEAQNMRVLLDIHNYGARALLRKGVWDIAGGQGRSGRFAIGSTEVPVAAFADICAKVAKEFGDHPALLGVDLMNEPVYMPGEGETWTVAAQAAIDAVRKVDPAIWLFVEGYHYANPFQWDERNPQLHRLSDPADRLVFSSHLYFDQDHSGRHLRDEADGPRSISTVGRAELDIWPFFDWLDQHGLRGHVGEFGIPDRPAWVPIAGRFLDLCQRQNVMLHAWADWPTGGNYVLGLRRVDDSPTVLLSELAARARQ